MSEWKWASASVIGTSHIKTETRKQDAFRCFASEQSEGYFVSVVSDGAGSAQYGGEGASLSCWVIANAISKHLTKFHQLPSDNELMEWIDSARDLIFAASERKGCTPREFAATLLVSISNGIDSLTAQIGDGCTVLRAADTGEWVIPHWPDHGEYASTTFFITDEAGVKCSIDRFVRPINSIVMFTDGLERLALNFSSHEPHNGFFEGITHPVWNSDARGKDVTLSKQLATFLGSDNVCSRTDDDKTLVVAVFK